MFLITSSPIMLGIILPVTIWEQLLFVKFQNQKIG
jgi:hypothetical protein